MSLIPLFMFYENSVLWSPDVNQRNVNAYSVKQIEETDIGIETVFCAFLYETKENIYIPEGATDCSALFSLNQVNMEPNQASIKIE